MMNGKRKTSFDAEFDDFYRVCLAELKGRANYTEAFLPVLDRYVTITSKLAKLNEGIVDEEVTVSHTNRAEKTNQMTSPKWRMFLQLNREALMLAEQLKLTPKTAPLKEIKEKKKGFILGEMEVSKDGLSPAQPLQTQGPLMPMVG